MSHSYSHHAPDPILGIRLGVNAADYANAEGLRPRGDVMKLAAQLAILQHSKAPRNARPTLRLENIKTAEIQCGGKKKDRRELEVADVKRMLSVDAETETERNRIARVRYAENRARREAAKEAKRAEAKAKREARKAAKEAANA